MNMRSHEVSYMSFALAATRYIVWTAAERIDVQEAVQNISPFVARFAAASSKVVSHNCCSNSVVTCMNARCGRILMFAL